MMDPTGHAAVEVHMHTLAWRSACKEIKTNSGNQLNDIGYAYQYFPEKYAGVENNWKCNLRGAQRTLHAISQSIS